IWDPKENKVVGLAGSGRSPQGLSLEMARSKAVNGGLPKFGAVSVSTPGAVDAWWTLHQRYGRLKWEGLFAPAIHIAEAGKPVPDMIPPSIRDGMANYRRLRANIEEIDNAVHTYGEGPVGGGVFRNPDLART